MFIIRKIFSPLTAIPVGKTEISGTEQTRPVIRTHRQFHKGFRGTARSLKPGSCEEALSKGVAEKTNSPIDLWLTRRFSLVFLQKLKREKSPSERNDQHSGNTPPQALRGTARNASDCWPGARNHGKEEEKTRLFLGSFPPSFARHFSLS